MDTLSLDLLMQLITHQLGFFFSWRNTHKMSYLPVGKGAPSRDASDVFRTLGLINITFLRSSTSVWKLIGCSEYLRDFLKSSVVIFVLLLAFQHWNFVRKRSQWSHCRTHAAALCFLRLSSASQGHVCLYRQLPILPTNLSGQIRRHVNFVKPLVVCGPVWYCIEAKYLSFVVKHASK